MEDSAREPGGDVCGWSLSLVLKIWEFGKCKKEEHSRKKEQHSEGMNSQSGFVVNGAWVRGSRAWCLVFEAPRLAGGL